MNGIGCYIVESCQKIKEGWIYPLQYYNANGDWKQTARSQAVKSQAECTASRNVTLRGDNDHLIPQEFRRPCTMNQKPKTRAPMAFQMGVFWIWKRS